MDKLYVIYVDPGGDQRGMVPRWFGNDHIDAANKVAEFLCEYVRVEVIDVSEDNLAEARTDLWT